MTLQNLITTLLHEDEDEYHDFKAEWYSKEDRAELIKDIFSFVNTPHHKDCYLIIGVDNNHNIVGIENDPNRLNTQKITDFLRNLPIANAHTPKVIVKTIELEGHTIDVMIIKDSTDVPVYLAEDKKPKRSDKTIHAGQVFSRVNENNTPIDGTANDAIVEQLWKKRFKLDLPIKEQYIEKLNDYSNWEYFELDKIGFRYNVNPDFCMYLSDDNEDRYRVESYTLGQYRLKMDWQKLTLKYKDRTIDELLVVFMDGARFLTVVPSPGSILDPMYDDPLPFQYFYADSIDYAVEKMILGLKQPAITPDQGQKYTLFHHIVVFENQDQKEVITDSLAPQKTELLKQCTPTKSEIKACQSTLSLNFQKDAPELNPSHIELMCEEAKVSQLIVDYLRNNNDLKSE